MRREGSLVVYAGEYVIHKVRAGGAWQLAATMNLSK